MNAPCIWLTRPREDSLKMQESLAALRIASMVSPVMEIEKIAINWPAYKPNAILVSSRHAAAMLISLPSAWRELPIYCVGSNTAKIAQQHGMKNVIVGKSGIQELLPKIRQLQKGGDRILYPCGEDIRLDVGPMMHTRGITLERLIVYNATATNQLAPELASALAQQVVQGVVLYSPRTVKLVQQLLSENQLSAYAAALDLYCLSPDIAEHAAVLGGRQIHTCAMPSHEAMMELLNTHAIRAA